MAYQKPLVTIELDEYNELKKANTTSTELAKKVFAGSVETILAQFNSRIMSLSGNPSEELVRVLVGRLNKLGVHVQVHGLKESDFITGKVNLDNIFITTKP